MTILTTEPPRPLPAVGVLLSVNMAGSRSASGRHYHPKARTSFVPPEQQPGRHAASATGPGPLVGLLTAATLVAALLLGLDR